MTEAELMIGIRDEALSRGLMVYHTRESKGWVPGFPDLVIVGPGGVIFSEVKSVRGRLSPAQWKWADKLLRAGAYWELWRPGDWPDQIRERLDRLAKV